MQKLKLSINKLQWIFLTNNLKQVVENSPIQDWELHSYTMCDCYERLLKKFTFFPADKKKISINLKLSEAQAINEYFAATSTTYNVILRMKLEPQLPPSKPQPNEEV